MISSSNFFNKNIFTIEQEEKPVKYQPYGPWEEERSQTISHTTKKNRNKRYLSVDRNTHNLSAIEKPPPSNLFSQHHRSLHLRKQKRQDSELELPPLKFPRINQYDLTNKIKYCLNLQDNMNFISKNSKPSYKKMVLKSDFDLIKPRAAVYNKCLRAAKQYHFESCPPNEVFYNG